MKKHRTTDKMHLFFRFSLPIILLLHCFYSNAQHTRKVLFLGNSYTGVNNLPQIVSDLASSAGDSLIFDSYTPGGYRLIDHYGDTISQNKIISGGWDYIVLQGQSQEPILAQGYFNNAGAALNNFINQYDACSVPLLYMTWGRKNGNPTYCPTYPVMCTYEGMDSTLRNNYLTLANNINAEVSPVSVTWNYIRSNYPGIELYDPDESHPSTAGSYAAACSFYATIFKKDPGNLTYNYVLNPGDAAIIRDAARTQVYNFMSNWDYKISPRSDFRYSIGSGFNQVIFAPIFLNTSETYFWDFGDGTTDSTSNPFHSYASDGTYTVTLTTSNCDVQGLHTSTKDTIIQFCAHTPVISTTQPDLCQSDTLWTQAADAYQWFYQEDTIPETNQYLANYYQYGIANFSVMSTISGCTELSILYTEVPQWSGYYFDLTPGADPCTGDTVVFTVLHINGFLSGTEVIQWYKNDTLLQFAGNDDSLLITGEGIYECKVVAPNSNCPLDTTSYSMQYTCGTVGIDESQNAQSWQLFPNPATLTVTVDFSKVALQDEILIYDITGRLKSSEVIHSGNTISVSELPAGIYFARLRNMSAPVLRFIKH